ncbi:MAG: DUF975 family protein [Clostridiales bacterium]|jgi:hypothetical protein|nr:DUF975 family protein [Clostridiales bacterium]
MKILTIVSLKQVMSTAKERLRGQRTAAICLMVFLIILGGVYNVAAGVIGNTGNTQSLWGMLFLLLIALAILWLQVHLNIFFIYIYRNQDISLYAYINSLGKNILRKTFALLIYCFLLFLSCIPAVVVVEVATSSLLNTPESKALWWLLYIPAMAFLILKSNSYSFTHYLLIEFTNIKAISAIKLSVKLTKGYRIMIFLKGLWFNIKSILILLPALIALCLGHLGIVLGMFLIIIATFIIIFSFVPHLMATSAGYYTEILYASLDNGIISYEELGEYE